MCRILVVDDEKLERDGILFLIKKYNLELEAFEAEDGEEALQFIRENSVDILLTDIKMPFLNGIELANAARTLYPELKIIIFSAYGEFEYARQAISIKVLHYLLKPVNTTEFFDLLTKVVSQCKSEKQEELEFQSGQQVLNMIQGIYGGKKSPWTTGGKGTAERAYTLLLADVRERFFDSKNGMFKQALQTQSTEYATMSADYINLNEFQGAILLTYSESQDADCAYRFAQELMEKMAAMTSAQITIIAGARIGSQSGLHDEFTRLEALLDYRFFHDSSIVIPAGTSLASGSDNESDFPTGLRKLTAAIDARDLNEVESGFDVFFNLLKGQGTLSTVYVKYICADLIKEMAEKMDSSNSIDLKTHIERVFSSPSLLKLRQNVTAVLQSLKWGKDAGRDEANKKVIGDVIELVECNYMKDISLDWIARSVYLSPSYLSYLFKRETGSSLIKYITSYRMDKARELLLNTNMRISDVGEAVGYPNSSYFGMAFRNHYSESPISFRENRGK